MDYNQALEYLFSQLPMFSRVGAPAYKPGLQTSLDLAEFFGNPHKQFKSIHVGGTNGKGSTSHMIASILISQGYKVGLYTSPHLVDFRERIKINGKMIPEEKVKKFVENWKASGYSGKPSFFELTMLMAFNWFAEEKVDFAVIEVGMGGRLDSTNIITPLLSVITNISHDHNQFLGETLGEIAVEKAGIIKQGIPVVIGESQPETKQVFIDKAKEEDTGIIFADKEINLRLIKSNERWEGEYEGLSFNVPLGGDYQKHNIKTVIAAVEELKKIDIPIDKESVAEGLSNVYKTTGLAGRWMIISHNPLVIADTGHNIAGLTYNFHQLYEMFETGNYNKLKVVIGFVADKAIDKILKILPRDADYYLTNAAIPRALPVDKLWEKFIENGIEGKIYRTVKEAYNAAKKDASEKDVIFIGGSTFIVADFLHYSCPYDGHDS